jgi:hypothetical protein
MVWPRFFYSTINGILAAYGIATNQILILYLKSMESLQLEFSLEWYFDRMVEW